MEMDELLGEIQALRTELNELKDLVHKGIIEPIEKDYNDRKRNEAQSIWDERYGEKLKPYAEKLKATEGDDFDLMRASYDAWNETDADSDEWVDELIKSIDESLKPLADVFGVPKEDLNATIEVENGEVTDVVADTEPEVPAEETTDEGSEETSDEDSEEEPKEEELSEEEQFQKELDDAYAKLKEKRY